MRSIKHEDVSIEPNGVYIRGELYCEHEADFHQDVEDGKIEYVDIESDEKLFEVEGGVHTLNEFLHANTHPSCSRIEEELIRRLLDLKVSEVIDDIDPNYPPIKRIK